MDWLSLRSCRLCASSQQEQSREQACFRIRRSRGHVDRLRPTPRAGSIPRARPSTSTPRTSTTATTTATAASCSPSARPSGSAPIGGTTRSPRATALNRRLFEDGVVVDERNSFALTGLGRTPRGRRRHPHARPPVRPEYPGAGRAGHPQRPRRLLPRFFGDPPFNVGVITVSDGEMEATQQLRHAPHGYRRHPRPRDRRPPRPRRPGRRPPPPLITPFALPGDASISRNRLRPRRGVFMRCEASVPVAVHLRQVVTTADTPESTSSPPAASACSAAGCSAPRKTRSPSPSSCATVAIRAPAATPPALLRSTADGAPPRGSPCCSGPRPHRQARQEVIDPPRHENLKVRQVPDVLLDLPRLPAPSREDIGRKPSDQVRLCAGVPRSRSMMSGYTPTAKSNENFRSNQRLARHGSPPIAAAGYATEPASTTAALPGPRCAMYPVDHTSSIVKYLVVDQPGREPELCAPCPRSGPTRAPTSSSATPPTARPHCPAAPWPSRTPATCPRPCAEQDDHIARRLPGTPRTMTASGALSTFSNPWGAFMIATRPPGLMPSFAASGVPGVSRHGSHSNRPRSAIDRTTSWISSARSAAAAAHLLDGPAWALERQPPQQPELVPEESRRSAVLSRACPAWYITIPLSTVCPWSSVIAIDVGSVGILPLYARPPCSADIFTSARVSGRDRAPLSKSCGISMTSFTEISTPDCLLPPLASPRRPTQSQRLPQHRAHQVQHRVIRRLPRLLDRVAGLPMIPNAAHTPSPRSS